jgi:hypothetical protein
MSVTVAQTPIASIRIGDLVEEPDGTIGAILEIDAYTHYTSLRVQWPDQSESYYPFINQCLLTYLGRPTA